MPQTVQRVFRRNRCFKVTAFFVVATCVARFSYGFADGPLKPPDVEISKAKAVIQSIYGKELTSTKRPADKATLGRQLIDKAREPNLSRAEQYVLLDTALPLVIEGADVAAALSIIDLQASSFGVPVLSSKASVLAKMPTGRLTGDMKKTGLEAAIKLLEDSLEADEYPSAVRIEKFAQDIARDVTTNDTKSLQMLSKRLNYVKGEFPKVEAHLKALEANEALPMEAKSPTGKWLCFAKRDWARGLPLLAQGTDARLSNIAKQDIESPQAAIAQADVGDLWWSYSETEKDFIKQVCQARATYWYRLAQSNLTGLRLTAVQKRLDSVPVAASSGIASVPIGEYRTFIGRFGYGNIGIFTADSRRILLAQDKRAVLYDIESQKEVMRFEDHSDRIFTARISQDGKRAVTVAADNKLRLFNALTGSLDRQFDVPTEGGGRFAMISQDGRFFAFTTGDSKTCRLWDIQSGKEVQRFNTLGTHHFRQATADGRRILSSGIENSVKMWDVPTGKLLLDWDSGQHSYSAILSHDGEMAITAGERHWDAWDMKTGRHIRRVKGFQGHTYAAALSSDKKRLVTGFNTGAVYVWDVATGSELKIFQGHRSPIEGTTISPDGRILATQDGSEAVRLWGLP